MSTNQFPPSSPFLDHHTADDPFSSKNAKSANQLLINSPFHTSKIVDYPTPNPSSSTGHNARSSSPLRNQEGASKSRAHTADVNKDEIIYKNPSKEVLRAKIYTNEKISLGRSSHCDYYIKSKFASRVHMKLHYEFETNQLTVFCKGYNGVIIHLGQTLYGYIKELEKDVYEFESKNKNEPISSDEEFNDIPVFRGEQLTVPYHENLKLDVKGHITVISVELDQSETETEDEMHAPIAGNVSSIEPQTTSSQSTTSHKDQDLTSSELSFIEDDQIISSPAPVQPASILKTPVVKPSREDLLQRSKSVEPQSLNEVASTPLGRSRSVEVEVEHSIPKKMIPVLPSQASVPSSNQAENRSPLKQKSENALNKQQSLQRRRKAEPGLSPQKKKADSTIKDISNTKEEYINPQEKIKNLNVEEIISTVDELDNIKNVLINHLAFSRLSQTPLKQLQSVSALTQNLTRQQLRAVLASIQCIGTIYRHGKDAAGKPLEEEYYYDTEKDQDMERTKLVSSIKGSSGLRNCRKTHKQYFWKKPVTKK